MRRVAHKLNPNEFIISSSHGHGNMAIWQRVSANAIPTCVCEREKGEKREKREKRVKREKREKRDERRETKERRERRIGAGVGAP